MNLNRIELRKIQYDFNSWSNRLLQADFNDYLDVLKKYIVFLDSTQIIFDYIADCGSCDFDVEAEVKEVQKSYGRMIFSVGDTVEKEVRNVYAILKYIADNGVEIQYGAAWGYSTAKGYQDKIKGFNDRFVMVLIRHIENFLTKAGIDMGLDEKQVYNVTVQNGQAIFAGDNATVTATNKIGVDTDELERLINGVKSASGSLSPEDLEALNECLEFIETEVKSEKPKKSLLRTTISTLQAIKGTADFGAAIATLIPFVTSIIS